MTLNNPLIRRSGLWPVLVMLASLASAKGPTDGQLFKEYMESAAKGDGDAIYSVGFCYWHGIGVAKNPVEAYAYWNLRGTAGKQDIRWGLQLLGKEMSPEEKRSGRARVSVLQKEIDDKVRAYKDSHKAAR